MTNSLLNDFTLRKRVLSTARCITSEAYQEAIKIVEEEHGVGYAKKNPHSVNQVMSFQEEVLRVLSSAK